MQYHFHCENAFEGWSFCNHGLKFFWVIHLTSQNGVYHSMLAFLVSFQSWNSWILLWFWTPIEMHLGRAWLLFALTSSLFRQTIYSQFSFGLSFLSLSSRTAVCEHYQFSDSHPQDHASQLEAGHPDWPVSQCKETNLAKASNSQEDCQWEAGTRGGI